MLCVPWKRAVAIAMTGALSTSCFVVTDLGRFEKAPPVAPSDFSDLRVALRGLTSHVNEKFEYRVVDSANVIQSRGFIEPLGGPDASFYVQGAVPKQNGPFRLDFYADHDSSGQYSPPPRPDQHPDHSWRLDLDDKTLDENGVYVVSFSHNQSFVNLEAPAAPIEFGKRCTVHLRAMDAFLGKRVEVRVGDASTTHIVAMYRVPKLTQPELEVVVSGMIETGVTYGVEVYTDDGAGGAVQAFRFAQLATDLGLEANFSGANPGARVPNPVSP